MSLRRAFWDAGGRAERLEAEEVSSAERAVFVLLMVTLLWPGGLGGEEGEEEGDVGEEVSRDSVSPPSLHQMSPEQICGGYFLKTGTSGFSCLAQ